MLFSVHYVKENIEDFQIVLNYFFNSLESNVHTVFSDDLFPESYRSKLHKYGNINNDHKKFVSVFHDIFKIYDEATNERKKEIINAFKVSNKIKSICGRLNSFPIHYDDMNSDLQKIGNHFVSFYDDSFGDLVNREIHIENYETLNGKVCPVCGLFTSYQYDHYFPKGSQTPIYPFSSVNPKNLIRVCQGCNGSKNARIIFYRGNTRESHNKLLVFSPYTKFSSWKNLNVILNVKSLLDKDFNVELQIKNGLNINKQNKIERWKEFFEIESRFSREIKINCINWISSFLIDKMTLAQMIAFTEPNDYKIKTCPGILIQNVFYKYLDANNIALSSFSRKPSDLLED